jgi:transglutaminase-like putative cysteine protease
VRAFYDYAGDSLLYTYNRRSWGAQATFGLMGADCTEYASLVIALSRAQGIPARYYEGLLYLEDQASDPDEAIAQTEHAWLDVYLPGAGWTALDPTLGRWPVNREAHFAHYTPEPHHRHNRSEPVHLARGQLLVAPVLAGESDHIRVTRAGGR